MMIYKATSKLTSIGISGANRQIAQKEGIKPKHLGVIVSFYTTDFVRDEQGLVCKSYLP